MSCSDNNTIKVYRKNAVWLEAVCSPAITAELREYFSFLSPSRFFHQAFKRRIWDGKIRLYNSTNGTLYLGLWPRLEEFAREHGYQLSYMDSDVRIQKNYTFKEIQDFVNSLNPHISGIAITPYDYQIEATRFAINHERALLLSPTSSGKSLIIYSLVRWYLNHNVKGKILITVPTKGLVEQLYNDFKNYSFANGWDVENNVHTIRDGSPKTTEKQVVISTWQAIYKQPKTWFSDFSVGIGDEAHQYKATTTKGIYEKLEDCRYRIGTTGTLDDIPTHRWILEGLFGPVFQVTTTKELMDNSIVSELAIRCVILNYPEEVKKALPKPMTYQDEIQFLIGYTLRNAFLRNLVLNLEGNTLLLLAYVEKHGWPLFQELVKSNIARGSPKHVFFVDKDTPTIEREKIRQFTDANNNVVIVATYGTFSQGVSIKNLHNIVFGIGFRAKIRNLQSIGRGLRLHFSKNVATLYDITDDLTVSGRKNYTLVHFMDRLKVYASEKFRYKLYNVKLVTPTQQEPLTTEGQ